MDLLNQEKTYAILLMAGSGTRLSSSEKKQYLISKRKKEPFFLSSLRKLEETNLFEEIILVVPKGDIKKTKSFLPKDKNYRIIEGGATREESAFLGLEEIKKIISSCLSFVLIHDADRPYISKELIANLINEAKQYGNAIPVTKSVDSLIYSSNEDMKYLARDNIFRVQTPQAFSFLKIYEVMQEKKNDLASYKDEGAILLDFYKTPLHLIPGEEINSKITTIEDFKRWEKSND